MLKKHLSKCLKVISKYLRDRGSNTIVLYTVYVYLLERSFEYYIGQNRPKAERSSQTSNKAEEAMKKTLELTLNWKRPDLAEKLFFNRDNFEQGPKLGTGM